MADQLMSVFPVLLSFPLPRLKPCRDVALDVAA